jgi:quinoprotein glucose dehydrogenase
MRELSSAPCAAALVCALLACGPAAGPIDYSGPTGEWNDWGGAKGGGRYSPLTQITRENVSALEPAWTYHTGHLRGEDKYVVFQVSPLVVDGTLYLCTPYNELVALDPETGKQLWKFDPELAPDESYVINCRGVSTWLDTQVPEGECRRRIIMGTVDARLIEVDARTGQRCSDFGKNGEIDLRPGLGEVRKRDYGVTSPPLVLGDRIITGAMVIDDTRVDVPGGVVRAFDVRTGALLWGWDPIPPGRPPLPAGPDGQPRFARGTSNAWTVLSGDPVRNLIFVPTGNTSPDYYGGHRDGLDYYSSSVVALDASTGRARWRFQAVHHDLWDYDSPAQPTLFEFSGAGGPRPALALPTKMGHLFLLDRETGEPLFPVEERPVPQQGAVPGELLSPTQPFPTRPPPLHPATLTPDEAWGFTFWDRGRCRDKIASLRSEGIFTPPSTQGSVHYPGMVGGMNWGSVSIDPVRQLLVTNLMRVATEVRLIPREEFAAQFPGEFVEPPWEPQLGTPYGLYRIPLLSPWGAPCNPPPWGTLAGIDLETGLVRWDAVLGTTRNLAPWPIWLELGAPNLGGSLVTASGLTFIAATTDGYLRAFDTETGEELWRGTLPYSAHATPITYRVRPEGKQYVVIAAGGHPLLGTELGDALVAFALP